MSDAVFKWEAGQEVDSGPSEADLIRDLRAALARANARITDLAGQLAQRGAVLEDVMRERRVLHLAPGMVTSIDYKRELLDVTDYLDTVRRYAGGRVRWRATLEGEGEAPPALQEVFRAGG